jgi:HK97 family phage major capsid protein
VAGGNADVGSLAFLTNSKVRGKLRLTFPNTTGGDTALWSDGPDGYGRLLGYRAAVSNQVRSDLAKSSSGSVLSGIFYGNWRDAILFMWGGVELIVDPYSLSKTGALRLVAFKSVDFKVRRTESFAPLSRRVDRGVIPGWRRW